MRLTIQHTVLFDTIKSTSYSMSKQEQRSNFQSMFFDFNNKEANIVATCGNTLVLNTITNTDYYNLENNNDVKFLLNRIDVNHLIAFLKNNLQKKMDLQVVNIEIAGIQITFELNGNKTVYNLMDADTFPDYKRVIPLHTYRTLPNNVLLNADYLANTGKIFEKCKSVEFLLNTLSNALSMAPVSIKSSHILFNIDVLYVIMPMRK